MLARLLKTMALALLAGGGPTAFAQGVGGDSPTNTSHTLLAVASIPEDPVNWLGRVGSPQNPLPVELDPSGPAWLTEFPTRLEQGEYIVYPAVHILVREHLLVEGDRPWAGWQMQILNEDFDWRYGGWSPPFSVLVDGFPAPVPAPGLNVQIVGSVASASFDPLPRGTLVEIRARLVYLGTEPFTDAVQVRQYPVPEPASAMLVVLGGVALSLGHERAYFGTDSWQSCFLRGQPS